MLWLITKRGAFQRLYLFWLKIFALAFGMGVVSGVVLSYEIGTNWSAFSRAVAGVIGPLLAFEVLTAFFLEASFLGVMLFGWKKVGPRLHFAATCLVAFGTLVSAFWIISANSWMQSPVAYAVTADGKFVALDWWRVIFSPTFPERLAHMVLAAYLSTALMVGAASAFALLKDPRQAESRIALRMAISMCLLVAPLQVVIGDIAGKDITHRQPAKLYAPPSRPSGTPRPAKPSTSPLGPTAPPASNRFEISIPKLGSWITAGDANAVVRGLKDFPAKDRPPVAVVFWAFRIMVGLGLAMIGLGVWGGLLWLRGGPERSRLFLRAATLMGPAGFAAVVAGWTTAEVGRQPWVVWGLMRTSQAVSPVTRPEVAASVLGFLIVYAIVFSVGALYILRVIAAGPVDPDAPQQEGPRAPGTAFAAAPPEPAPPEPAS